MRFGFVRPGGGDGEGVGHSFGSVGNLKNLGYAGSGSGREMGGGQAGNRSVARFPPAVNGRGEEENATEGDCRERSQITERTGSHCSRMALLPRGGVRQIISV